MKKVLISAMVLLISFVPVVLADDEPATLATVASEEAQLSTIEPEVTKGSCLNCPAEKLGRGVSNIFFSIFEVPYNVGKEFEKTNYIGGLFTGTLKGVFWTVVRLTAGAIDTATFFIPTKPFINEYDAGWWQA